jgi:hypothetical protein
VAWECVDAVLHTEKTSTQQVKVVSHLVIAVSLHILHSHVKGQKMLLQNNFAERGDKKGF